jgi:glycine cleavage system H protein
MSDVRDNLLYTKDDEWVSVDGDTATVGITDHAQDALSDIVYLELPAEGDSFGAGETFGVVESVKAAADLLMPVDGEIIAANDDLVDEPEVINDSPYDSWMVKFTVSDAAQLDELMNAEQYKAYLAERE